MSTEEAKKLELAEPQASKEQPSEEPQPDDAPEDSQPTAEAGEGPGDEQTVEEPPTEPPVPEIQPLPKEEAKAESTGKRSPTPEAAKPKSSGKGSLEAHVDLLDGEVLQLQDLEVRVCV